MADEKAQRRVKVTGEGAVHRVGAKRAAVKPKASAANAGTASAGSSAQTPNIKQIVTSFVEGLRAGSLTQTYTGSTLTKNAAAIRSNFGLASTDELYLLLDPTATGRAGMLLSASGLHLADGRGGKSSVSWKDFAQATVGYQRGMLVIGQSGIASKDAKTILELLEQIQAKLA